MRPVARCLALAAAALCLFVGYGWTPAGPARALTSGVPGPIVYAAQTPTSTQLYTLVPGGESVIVPNTYGARSARWSPDGKILAFGRWGGGIFLVNPDGSGVRRLFTAAEGEAYGEPVWSPDGQRLAYIVYEIATNSYSIEVADSLDGVRERVETDLVSVWEWLADGTFLGAAFRYKADLSSYQEELAEHRPDGSTHYLTNTLAYQEGQPRLSPDGTRITFLSYDWFTDENGFPAPGNQYRIGVINRDGSGRKLIATTDNQVTWPAWSPDGTQIVFGPTPTVIRPDGTGRATLSGGLRGEDGLDWAPLVGTVPPVEIEGVRALALRDPSALVSTSSSATTIWPIKDGYRDTVQVNQRLNEPAKAYVKITNSAGTVVRTVTYEFDTGVNRYTWNGRTSTGSILPAGKYKIETITRDLAGNRKTVAHYVTLYRGAP